MKMAEEALNHHTEGHTGKSGFERHFPKFINPDSLF